MNVDLTLRPDLVSAIYALLPASLERRADAGKEDGHGHASDARGRPGAVSPDP